MKKELTGLASSIAKEQARAGLADKEIIASAQHRMAEVERQLLTARSKALEGEEQAAHYLELCEERARLLALFAQFKS